MIICPACSSEIQKPGLVCPSCGFQPSSIDGFTAWAPLLAHENNGFSSDSFSELYEVEANNFWFISRNRLIVWALQKYFPKLKTLLEVGCGTGYVISGIASAFPEAQLSGSEIYTEGLVYAEKRVGRARLMQADARHLPFSEEFDVVAAFDVLEHIDEDDLAIESISRSIKSGGGCIFTVPQHMWMWSSVDEAACHKRRYRTDELQLKLESVGLKVVHTTSFVTLLLPLMLLSRIGNKSDKSDVSADSLKINPVLNFMLLSMMRFERILISLGVRFPFGGSRLVVAVKE